MRVPQVSDRIKEAPAQALRGVFAGIGQLLLITDKLRNKTPADQQVRQACAPEPSETHADPVPPAASAPPVPSAASAPPAPSAASAPPAPSVPQAPPAPQAPPTQRVTEARDFDKTGNVRLLSSEEAGADRTAPASDATATVSENAAVAGKAEAEPGAPLPNYDELSIASLRARLRNLDLTQLRQLAFYEQAHAARADVMTMFERRIAKLEAEASADRQAEADAEAEAEAREDVAGEVRAEVEAEAEA